MKKALFIATVGSFFGFERNDIKILQSLGFEVHIAANLYISECDDFQEECIIRHQIDFARIPWSKTNLNAYKQLKVLFGEMYFDIVHCHTPMGGILGRLAVKKYRKTGTKVFYTAHGFHFYKRAPLKNWLLFFPAEWICSFWTDVLITINREDYAFAQRHLHAKRTEYVPGVGIDTKKFSPDVLSSEERTAMRAELDVGQEDRMLLSVGELIPRKNHEAVIRAIGQLADPRIRYFICGQGELREKLQKLVDDNALQDQVRLLGYRADISRLCDCADLFVFPSLQEGLPVALMEAVASKIPVICSDIRGNSELVGTDALFDPKDSLGIAGKIEEYLNEDKRQEAERNYERLQRYDLKNVMKKMRDTYKVGETV